MICLLFLADKDGRERALLTPQAELAAELREFPARLRQFNTIRVYLYELPLSGRTYSSERVSRGTHFCGASPVERIVTRTLSHALFLDLEIRVHAGLTLYDEAADSDRALLLRMWKEGSAGSSSFPARLLSRYRVLKEDYHRGTPYQKRSARA